MAARQRAPKRTLSDDGNSEYENWLLRLDQEAEKLEPGGLFLYDPFMLERYPRLRSASEREREAVENVISLEATRIGAHPKAERVLNGLDTKMQRQLAALAGDVREAIRQHSIHSGNRTGIAALERQAPPAQRRLDRLTADAVNTLRRMRACADGLPRELGVVHSNAASEALKALSGARHRYRPDSSATRMLDTTHPYTEDQTTFAMVRLYWFFRFGCGLTGDESEVRVALLRNAFWQPWAEPVTVLEQYIEGESQGSTAVRMAVARFRLDRGTAAPQPRPE